MNLVLIYGPPAAGKLTVARALALLTGYKVFHNHLTFDYTAALFEPMSKPFWRMCDALRLKTMELAAECGLEGMIFTFCYAHPQDAGFVQDIRSIVEAGGGQVFGVHLYCDRDALLGRVALPDREAFQKLRSVQGLEQVLDRHDFFTPVPDLDTLGIDNTALAAGHAAAQIAAHFGLAPKSD